MTFMTGKAAIITGASAPRGIGRAIALRLAAEGATVIVTDVAGRSLRNGIDQDRLALLEELASEIQAEGGQALAMSVDVTEEDDVRQCVTRTRERFEHIDILVNNAGSLAGTGDFLQTTPAQWEASFRVNLLGPMMFSRAVIPEMRAAGGGAIVNIGSTGSLGAEAGFGAYTTMKHGLIGMTKTIAAEFGVDGIRCNAVCPGYVMTDMHAAANERLAGEANIPVAEMMARRYAGVALRRAAEPNEIADAVAYLTGPQAQYITGVALPVAGGVPFGL